jgi:hypothetical protein
MREKSKNFTVIEVTGDKISDKHGVETKELADAYIAKRKKTYGTKMIKDYGIKFRVKSNAIKENTIAQFFTDTGFAPPEGHNMFNFGFGFDTGVDEDMKHDGYDGIPSNIADVLGDVTDPDPDKDRPLPSLLGDYFMFNDPGERNNPDLRTPPSQIANSTNVQYHKKDLSRIDSASDVHLESLEQPVGEFPRHTQIHSQMEPSMIGSSDYPQPGEVILEQPLIIEGKKYPAGTRLIEVVEGDDLYESPDAKLCPLCYEPYLGGVCPRCESGQPGTGAVEVTPDWRRQHNLPTTE